MAAFNNTVVTYWLSLFLQRDNLTPDFFCGTCGYKLAVRVEVGDDTKGSKSSAPMHLKEPSLWHMEIPSSSLNRLEL